MPPVATKLPAPDQLTETASAAVAGIIAQADAISSRILSSDVPHVADHLALRGLVALGTGSGLFAPTPNHTAALDVLPRADELAEWDRRERELSLVRHGSAHAVWF